MSRPFDFSTKTRNAAFFRQRTLCAHCGTGLRNKYDHAHHVVPNQAGNPGNASHSWLKHVENCVVLCEPCHHRVHENGDFRNGAVALPEYYRYSHGDDVGAHTTWAEELDSKAASLYRIRNGKQ